MALQSYYINNTLYNYFSVDRSQVQGRKRKGSWNTLEFRSCFDRNISSFFCLFINKQILTIVRFLDFCFIYMGSESLLVTEARPLWDCDCWMNEFGDCANYSRDLYPIFSICSKAFPWEHTLRWRSVKKVSHFATSLLKFNTLVSCNYI